MNWSVDCGLTGAHARVTHRGRSSHRLRVSVLISLTAGACGARSGLDVSRETFRDGFDGGGDHVAEHARAAAKMDARSESAIDQGRADVGQLRSCMPRPRAGQAGPEVRRFATSQIAGPGIALGPDGDVWFTEASVVANAVARIRPDGSLVEFRLPTDHAHPFDIATAGGHLWLTEFTARQIAWISPDGAIAELAAPGYPLSIQPGPNGDPWFVLQGNDSPHGIARMSLDGTVTLTIASERVTTETRLAWAPDGKLWFTGDGITSYSAAEGLRELMSPLVSTVGLAWGPDDAFYFTEPLENRIGRVTIDGDIREFDLPTPSSWPRQIVVGPDCNLWFSEYRSAKLGRMTTDGVITEFSVCPDLCDSPIPVRLDKIVFDDYQNLWFIESASGEVGRFRTP
jgi:virginiamycin B lyase